jgi:hypothetical protein
MFEQVGDVKASKDSLDTPYLYQNNAAKFEFKGYIVIIIGYEFSKLDMQLLLQYINLPFQIKNIIGSSSVIKQLN